MKHRKSGPPSKPGSALPQAKGVQLIELFNAGRYAELETQARSLAEQYPGSGFVWKVLGTALLTQGKDGLLPMQKAVALMPADVESHGNLGNALKAVGRLDEAVASYRQALVLKPDFVAGLYNLGIALKDLGHLDEAVASYRQALALNPAFADAHYNLGIALKDLGHLDEAVASYRQALALKPDYVTAHFNLGQALRDLGRLDEAVTSYRWALALNPEYAEAHCTLGIVLADQGKLDEAAASHRQALALKPDFSEAHNNLGNVLKDLGQHDAAMASYRRALEARADFAEAHNNLGNVYKDLGRFDDAIASYRHALEINPDFAEACGNLLFTRNYVPDQAADMLLAEARHYGDLVARPARPYAQWPNVPDAQRKLRVGFVSGDFNQHPVGYFIEGVLSALAADADADADRDLDLFAYANQFSHDALTERIKASCQGWCTVVGLSDQRLAERIRDDGIDILIDLSGHTAHSRLPMFAFKPAPVQVTWLGYFATTGVAAIDYLIADPWTLPEAQEAHFTEQIWRLPDTRLCFTPPDLDVPVSLLPAQAQGQVTFGCFNNLTKMNDAVVALWARVLRAVPGSRLFLKAEQLGAQEVRQGVIQRFAAQGIEADRLMLQGPSPRASYLAAYEQVDICLDPFPFTGGATSAESLWMGVPVLTLAGERFVARQGVGLMTNAGLPDWVATDADDYVQRAIQHAADLPRLAALRAGLRSQVLASPVFDAPRFARSFRAALRGMWTRWAQRGELSPGPVDNLVGK